MMIKKPVSNRKRQKKSKKNKEDLGLKRLDLWFLPDDIAEVKALEKKSQDKAKKLQNNGGSND